MEKNKIIDKLNDCLRHEWTGVAQYAQAGFVVAGLWREVYSGMFFDSAKESFGHAKQVGEKIVALGGVPTVERNPVKQTDDLQELLEFRGHLIQHFHELIRRKPGHVTDQFPLTGKLSERRKHVAGVRDHACGERRELPIFQSHDAVGNIENPVVVRYEQDRALLRLGKVLQYFDDFAAGFFVQGGSRFVGKNDFRVSYQRPRNRNALFLTAG